MDCGHLEFTAWTFVLLYMGNNLWLSKKGTGDIFSFIYQLFFFFNLTFFCLHHVCSALVFLAVHDSAFLCLKTFLQGFKAGGVFPFPERRSVCGQEQLSLCLAVMTTPQVPKQQTPFSLSQTSVMTDKWWNVPSSESELNSLNGQFCLLLPTGHNVKQVMWFRVSAEGRREFAHHTDPNQISLSYRGRTR